MTRWGRILVRGLIAGIIGGALIDAFVYFVALYPSHIPITAMWQFAASIAMGKSASAANASPWLGLMLLAFVSIAWGIGYAYIAQTRENVAKTPLVSGLVFGVIVYIVMQFLILVAGAWTPPNLQTFIIAIVAYAVFFGVPVAYGVRLFNVPR